MPTTSQTGIVTAVIGNIAINVALNLQRYAKHRLIRLALYGVHAPTRANSLRFLAMALLVAGQLINLVAYGLAPASIVSPLGVLAVISNCIIPPLLFDETPTIHNITGTTIALPGILLLIVSAPQDDIEFSWPLAPPAKLFLASICVLISACSLVRSKASAPKIVLRVDSCITAAMGTFCVLSIKCIGLVLWSRDEEKGGLLLMLALVVTVSGLLQMLMIVSIFERFPIWQAVPHLFAFFTVLSGMGSAIIFHEFRQCGLVSKLEFLGGLVLVVAGVWVSAKPHETKGQFLVQTRSALNGPRVPHGRERKLQRKERLRQLRADRRRERKARQKMQRKQEQELERQQNHQRQQRLQRTRPVSRRVQSDSRPISVPRAHTRQQSYPADRAYLSPPRVPLHQEIIVHTSPQRPATREAMISVDEHTYLLMPRNRPRRSGSRWGNRISNFNSV